MTLRIGLLAAAAITHDAVIEPAKEIEGVELVAVAARDLERARVAASEWGIATAYGSYEELLVDADIDAVYVATPASLHRRWAVATLEAGKHVLVEKPLASNAEDAGQIAAAAAAHPDLVAMEAFHWRYHPLAGLCHNLLAGGRIGVIQRIEAEFNLPESAIGRDDIRWNLELGGGATMDLGCYSIQWVRVMIGGQPEVVSATAVTPVSGVDGRLDAELRWISGVTGRVTSSMIEPGSEQTVRLAVTGADGELIVTNLLAPHCGSSVEIRTAAGTEHIDGTALAGGSVATYTHQLIAFRNAITDGTPVLTSVADGVANMEVIDACYRAAGLHPR